MVVPPMAPLYELWEVIAFVSTLLVVFLNVQDALQEALWLPVLDTEDQEAVGTAEKCQETLLDM
jgi:hypothetical protein